MNIKYPYFSKNSQQKNGQLKFITTSQKCKWPISIWKTCSAIIAINEMQIKITLRWLQYEYHRLKQQMLENLCGEIRML